MNKKEKKEKVIKIMYLTVSPRSLASTITCERVMEFLDSHGLSNIVIEHPSLLSPEEFQELSRLVDFEWKTEYIKWKEEK